MSATDWKGLALSILAPGVKAKAQKSHVCFECDGSGGLSGKLPDGSWAECCDQCRGQGALTCDEEGCPICDQVREDMEMSCVPTA